MSEVTEAEAERLTAANDAAIRMHRQTPRPIDFLACCRAVPGLALQFSPIPESYWSRSGTDVVVACPCGASPVAVYAVPVACECDRWFLNDGRNVRVARYPCD